MEVFQCHCRKLVHTSLFRHEAEKEWLKTYIPHCVWEHHTFHYNQINVLTTHTQTNQLFHFSVMVNYSKATSTNSTDTPFVFFIFIKCVFGFIYVQSTIVCLQWHTYRYTCVQQTVHGPSSPSQHYIVTLHNYRTCGYSHSSIETPCAIYNSTYAINTNRKDVCTHALYLQCISGPNVKLCTMPIGAH